MNNFSENSLHGQLSLTTAGCQLINKQIQDLANDRRREIMPVDGDQRPAEAQPAAAPYRPIGLDCCFKGYFRVANPVSIRKIYRKIRND